MHNILLIEIQRVSDRFLQTLLTKKLIQPDVIAAPKLHLAITEQRHIQEAFGDIRYPLVILYPDAGMAIKRWPTANFISLGEELQHGTVG
ncbi:MAG: hypothetical protein AB1589_08785 [Cyanobacteriota bacterium]